MSVQHYNLDSHSSQVSPSSAEQPNDISMNKVDRRKNINERHDETDSSDEYMYFILLIQPQDRQFELLHISNKGYKPSVPQNIDDILPLIVEQTAEPKFRKQKHIGVCHLPFPKKNIKDDENRIDKNNGTPQCILNDQQKPFCNHRYYDNYGKNLVILHGDILVAVPEGYDEEFCRLAGQFIFQKNPRLHKWIYRTFKKHRKNKKKMKRNKRRNKNQPLQERKHEQRSIPFALVEENTDQFLQETHQQLRSKSYAQADCDDQIRMLNCSPTCVSTPLNFNDKKNSSEQLISPPGFFTPEEKMFNKNNEDKQLQCLDYNTVSTETTRNLPPPSRFMDEKVRMRHDLVEVGFRKPVPIRENAHSVRTLSPQVPPSSLSFPHLPQLTKESLRIYIRQNSKQNQLKVHKKAVVVMMASILFFMHKLMSEVSASFRVTKNVSKRKHLDVDGIIQVVIMMALFSTIQANWEWIQKQYIFIFGKKRTKRSSRRLIPSKSVGSSFPSMASY